MTAPATDAISATATDDLLQLEDLKVWFPIKEGIVFERHNARPRSPMPESVRRRLEDQLAGSDAALARWLGGPPSWRA